MPTQPASDLATLNRDIAQLETEAARFGVERTAVARVVGRIRRHSQYLRLARWFRSPRASFTVYPIAVFAIGPLVCGVVAMIFVSLFVTSWALPFGGFFVGGFVGLTLMAALLYRPSDELLPSQIAEAEATLRVENSRLAELTTTLADTNARLAELLEARQQLATSDKLQRAMLLQRNWKALRGTEWEDYVVEVCRTLGANVHRGESLVSAPATPSGPRGVVRRPPTLLLITFSPRRFAVAAVSEIRPFHTAAVQQIAAELAQHGCDALAIITNTRITAGSKELACGRNCTLLGEDEFPDFVLGKATL